MHPFTCNYRCSCGREHQWPGTWELLRSSDETDEIRIRAHGKTFDSIIGTCGFTDYFCIPDCNVGIGITSFKDYDQIEGSLSKLMSWDDAATVASALRDYFS